MNKNYIDKEHIFAKRLKYLRKNIFNGISQKDLAAHLCISQPTLSGYESGRISPTIGVVIQIAKKCNVSVDWLCGCEEHHLNYMSDLASFLFDMYEAEQFHCRTDIFDSDGCKVDIEQYKEIRKRISLTFFVDDKIYNPDWVYSEEICQLIKTVSELHSELIHYDCSQDFYNTRKAMIIDSYRNLPITRIDLSGISESERICMRKDKLLEDLKYEMSNGPQN